ncbi:MAG: NUDIX hydrolase [SAR202 cluster bacterium]|nr:NUDIX hydrolase [SAR202 cluster bacterium]
MSGSESEPTVETQVVFRGRIMNVRVDKVQLPSGRVTTREIAEHGNSVCIVPLDGQGNVVLVRQYRKPANDVLLEVPAGGINHGEVSEETVLRELQEETGFTAGKLRHLSSFWVSPGWCTEYMHAYLATELTPSKLEADDDENITVVSLPLNHVPKLIASGEIQDAKSIAALLLAMQVQGT